MCVLQSEVSTDKLKFIVVNIRTLPSAASSPRVGWESLWQENYTHTNNQAAFSISNSLYTKIERFASDFENLSARH